MLPPFRNIFVVDFEFVADPGERPKPVCVVFHEINSGNTQKIWLEGRDPLSINPPYPMGEDNLFIAYYKFGRVGLPFGLKLASACKCD